MVDIRRDETSARATGESNSRRPFVNRRTVFSLSEEETVEFGQRLGRGLQGGELILLEGELGLGKTVLTKGIAAGLGVSPDMVTSPSFTLVQEYTDGRMPLFHVDLYRVDDPEEYGTLGIEEILTAGGVVVVEWGEKLPPYLRRGAITIRFHDVGEGSRRIEILPDSGGSTGSHADA